MIQATVSPFNLLPSAPNTKFVLISSYAPQAATPQSTEEISGFINTVFQSSLIPVSFLRTA